MLKELPYNEKTYEDLCLKNKVSFLQSLEWSKVKSISFGVNRYILKYNDFEFPIFLQIRTFKFIRFGYLAHPLTIYKQGQLILPDPKLIASILNLLKITERLDFLILEPITDLENYSEYNARLLPILQDSGFIKGLESFQPRYTNIIKLHLSEEELFKNLERETRRRLKKLEMMENVKVEITSNLNDLEKLYNVLKENASFKKYHIRSFDYYERMFIELKEKMVIVVIKRNGKIVGGYINILFNSVCSEIYGGCDWDARKDNLNILLKWKSILIMKNLGAVYYDQWGASGSLKQSKIYFPLGEFKKNFGGYFIEYLPQQIYFYNKLYRVLYKMFRIFAK